MNSKQKPNATAGYPWSAAQRLVASLLIAAYLGIVISGPTTNSISSDLTNAIGQTMEPVHQAMHLGHGYRYFGHNPGQSHLLRFEVGMPDRSIVSGQLPDRDEHWPRLLYHRWFMLSETLFGESFLKPSKPAFEERSKEYDRQLQALIASNEMSLHRRLSSERELEIKLFEKTNQRVEAFTKAIAKVLLERNSGESIELFVRERGIPFPEQVRRGIRLDDESYLSEKLKIGQLNAEGFRLFEMTAIPEEIQ